jgi:hypothetical protein
MPGVLFEGRGGGKILGLASEAKSASATSTTKVDNEFVDSAACGDMDGVINQRQRKSVMDSAQERHLLADIALKEEATIDRELAADQTGKKKEEDEIQAEREVKEYEAEREIIQKYEDDAKAIAAYSVYLQAKDNLRQGDAKSQIARELFYKARKMGLPAELTERAETYIDEMQNMYMAGELDLVELKTPEQRAELLFDNTICTAEEFAHPPWAVEGAKVWRSKKITHLVDLIRNRRAGGVKEDSVTLGDVFDLCAKHANAYIFGGFVRDAIAGVQSNDIDITFATDKQGIANLGAEAKKLGWNVRLISITNERIGKKSDGKYIGFGNGKDGFPCVEGRLPWNGETPEKEFGWQYGDFSCNSMMYCLNNNVVVERAPFGIDDAKHRILRVPLPLARRHFWAPELNAHIRWIKFRLRGFKGERESTDWMVTEFRQLLDKSHASYDLHAAKTESNVLAVNRIRRGYFDPVFRRIFGKEMQEQRVTIAELVHVVSNSRQLAIHA